MKRSICFGTITAGLLLLGNLQLVWAQQIVTGTYRIDDGKVSGFMTIMPGTGAGKYIFEGGVKAASGAECMMNGPATLQGSELEIGYKCTVRLTVSEKELVVDDYKKCIPCDPGAYVSGTYKKQ